jgi:hypothetical protein
MERKSSPHSPNNRFVIAWGSPWDSNEVGPLIAASEKKAYGWLKLYGGPFSAVRFVEQKPQKTGIIHDFDGKCRQKFSAVQTAWRREWHIEPLKLVTND